VKKEIYATYYLVLVMLTESKKKEYRNCHSVWHLRDWKMG